MLTLSEINTKAIITMERLIETEYMTMPLILVLLLSWRFREEKTMGLYSKMRITLMKP